MTKVSTHESQAAFHVIEVRSKRVILDADLAALYGVRTKRLNEQVRRNAERFPLDFAFLLSPAEWESLRSQVATLRPKRGQHRRFLPYVFTVHGLLMAASVLSSRRAIAMSIYVLRISAAMQEVMETSPSSPSQLEDFERAMERRLSGQDAAITALFDAIRVLVEPKGGR